MIAAHSATHFFKRSLLLEPLMMCSLGDRSPWIGGLLLGVKGFVETGLLQKDERKQKHLAKNQVFPYQLQNRDVVELLILRH